MNIIALDTATEVMSLALSCEAGLWYLEIDAGSRHSELLMEGIDNLCGMAGIKPKELNMAACMKGPGSFTGLRIGFSAAKGLALSLGIPLAAVPTLDCAAHFHSVWPGIVVPCIDSKKGCFFTAFYGGGKLLGDYLDAAPETIAEIAAELSFGKQILLTGTGADMLLPRLRELLPDSNISIDPAFRKGRAKELLDIIKSGKVIKENHIDSGPLYLRKSDAEINKSTADGEPMV